MEGKREKNLVYPNRESLDFFFYYRFHCLIGAEKFENICIALIHFSTTRRPQFAFQGFEP